MRALPAIALVFVTLTGCSAVPGSTAAPVSYIPPPAGSFAATTVTVSFDGTAETTPAAVVTRDFFPAVKLLPLLGREFVDGEWTGTNRVVVLREDLWRRRLGGAPDVIGREIQIDGAPATIVGIMPRGFDAPPGAQVWLTRAALIK